MARLEQANAQVFGISVDTFFTLKAFHDQQKLTFPLLSDFNKQVIRDYGVFNEDMIGLKGIAKRAVFVIDKDGVVRHRRGARGCPERAGLREGVRGSLRSRTGSRGWRFGAGGSESGAVVRSLQSPQPANPKPPAHPAPKSDST